MQLLENVYIVHQILIIKMFSMWLSFIRIFSHNIIHNKNILFVFNNNNNYIYTHTD